MADKINVDSGNPYRDQSGHFGTSPDDALKASFATLQGKKLVKPEDNQKKVEQAKADAEAKLAALRSAGSSSDSSSSLVSGKEFATLTPADFDKAQSDIEALDGNDPTDLEGYAKYLDNVTAIRQGLYEKEDKKLEFKQVNDFYRAQLAGATGASKMVKDINKDDRFDIDIELSQRIAGGSQTLYRGVEDLGKKNIATKIRESEKDGKLKLPEAPQASFTSNRDSATKFGRDGIVFSATIEQKDIRTAPAVLYSGSVESGKRNSGSTYSGLTNIVEEQEWLVHTGGKTEGKIETDKKPEAKQSVKAINANITEDQQRQIDLATAQFKQSVERVDNQILQKYIQAVQEGDYAAAERILEEAQESPQVNTLMFALLTIGVILLPIYARQRLQKLLVQFGLNTIFANTEDGQKELRKQAERGAKSHVETIAKDIKKSLDNAIDTQLTDPTVEVTVKDKYEKVADKNGEEFVKAVKDDTAIYEYARNLVLSGLSRNEVIKKIQEEFNEVSNRRANIIAGNESNRVFNTSQFEADSQFLAENQLTDKAYKRLVSNTGTPEALCKSIIDKTHATPIPFKEDFIAYNKVHQYVDERGKTRKFRASFERIRSGTIHVNCHCRYELLIKQDDGTFFNTYSGKVENAVGVYDEKKHKRAGDGKFAKKPKSFLDVSDDGVLDISKIKDEESFNNFVENSKQIYISSEARAAKLYQSPHFYKINQGFQVGAQNVKINDEKLSLDKFSKTFDPAFDIKTKTKSTLYRGVNTSPKDFKVGQEYDNDGYTSTSFVEQLSRDRFKGPGGSVIHLSVPANTEIAVPDLISRDITNSSMGEFEAILKRGASYRVDKIEGDVVYATLV